MSDNSISGAVLAGTTPRREGRRLSAILTELAKDENRPRISIGDLLDVSGNRAFGALVFIFAAPNALPSPVLGLSSILGAPLLLLTWQLMIGQPQPWLPGFIRDRSFDRRDFSRLVDRIVPWLQRIERTVRPRLLWMTEPAGERLIGLVCFLLALVLVLPIPLGNMLPGLALSLLALGILERDGVSIFLGTTAGLLALVLVSGVLYGLAKAALFIVRNAIGI